MRLDVRGVSLSLGERKRDARKILDDVSFTAPDGAFVSLLGESGAGKSTLLKVVAGILLQDEGSVCFDGRVVDGLPSHKRNLGFVFQDVRLFPHMSVAENVAYPLRMAGVGKRERLARAADLLERVALAGFGDRSPATLSGGQAQRVALARALAGKPAALLLDEPFSGLDESLREDMRSLVLRLHREEGVTCVMVTHDAVEALMMSDVVVALDAGRVVQAGVPQDLYERPATRKIAASFGDCSVLSGEVRGGAFRAAGLALPAPGVRDGAAVAVLRHCGLALAPADAPEAPASAGAAASGVAPVPPGALAIGEAIVRCGVFAGESYLARLDVNDETLTVPVAALPAPGSTASVFADPGACFVFSAPE